MLVLYHVHRARRRRFCVRVRCFLSELHLLRLMQHRLQSYRALSCDYRRWFCEGLLWFCGAHHRAFERFLLFLSELKRAGEFGLRGFGLYLRSTMHDRCFENGQEGRQRRTKHSCGGNKCEYFHRSRAIVDKLKLSAAKIGLRVRV